VARARAPELADLRPFGKGRARSIVAQRRMSADLSGTWRLVTAFALPPVLGRLARFLVDAKFDAMATKSSTEDSVPPSLRRARAKSAAAQISAALRVPLPCGLQPRECVPQRRHHLA